MKKILTIMALLVAFVTTGFADSYYIVGDLAGGWIYAPVANGNYLEMQLVEGSTNTYFADITSLSGDKYFCLADGDGSDWDDFNGNHRYSANEANYSVPTDGTSFQLGKNGDRSMKITGDGSNYHFVFNADTKMLTVTKNSDITNVALRGATDSNWENQFNLSLTKQSDFVYTGTLDLTEATTDAYFKLVINGSSWIGYGALTLDTELPITAEHGNNGDNFKLAHSNGVYKTYTVTATWTEGTNVSTGWTLKIEGKDERVAEISSVFIHGALASDTQWANALTLPLTGSENVYSQTVPLTTTLQDLVFELQVNGQNVRYNDVTIDPASTELLVDGGGNEHFILFKNSISGYDTYLATATWTPNPDPKAGWTLKVVGVHERTLDYAIVGDLTGGWPATTDDDGSKDVSMTAQNNGLYTLVVDEFAAEANTTYEYKLRTNKMWNLFDLPGNGNASWAPTEAGNYKLTFVANVTGTAITDDTFGEIAAYTVTVVPEKIVVSEDYYVIGNNGTKWVALGKMDYFAAMEEYNYNLDETWTGKYFAIAPASALNGDGDVVEWSKVVRPNSVGNFLVELRNYYDDVVTGGENVWEKTDEITRLSIHYYIDVQDFALNPESDVTISDAGYATYSNKFDYFTFDVKVSIVKNVEGNKAVLEELEFLDGANKGISGGTGVILEKVLAETDVVTIYPYDKEEYNEYVDVTGNMLIGSGNYTYNITGEYPGGGNYTAYILAKKDNGVGFYLFDDSAGIDIPAHKAFLAVPGTNAAPFFGFADAETTGINSLTPTLSEGEGVYYTLDGRRVENPTKGLYIVNGKKVLVP